MKHIFLILFSLGVFLSSCTEKRDAKPSPTPDLTELLLEVPNTIVDKSALTYDNKRSIWTLNGQLYSGYAASYYQDGTLQRKMGILEGKKQNESIEWYADGHYKQVANYHLGKLHGEKKIWSSESPHILIAHFNFHAGKAHGEQKKWYPTGELFQKINLNMGREDGIQQAYRKNGALFANYEAKKGRIFGLKRAALCFSLEEEGIQNEK
ncbi:MAG: toxin-antitoxin system YwqK family antitoxin [Bacteroidia bacterium]